LILYPFHPWAGQMVQVEHRKRFAGEDHLVVVQPDGTLALIPAWMSEDSARSATLTASPRLAVGRLFELRARIDVLIAYAGVYAFGRTGSRISIEAGRECKELTSLS
jgi:Family of unknown function (DUF5372)